MRRFVPRVEILAVLLAASVTLASASAGFAADLISNPFEIRVGIVAPMTGPVPEFGSEVKNGVMLAVQEWNDQGGVGGKRIVTFVEDGQCQAEAGVAAARRLLADDQVHYVIGEVCSAASIPISEMTNAARVIQITPTSTNLKVTVDASGAVKPYTFRDCFVDPYQGVVGARFAFNNLNARTAFVMGDPGNGYVTGLRDSFVATFTALGGKVVGTAEYDGSTDTDFSDILSKIRSAKPDVIYLPDYYNVVNLVAAQARRGGMTIPFLGGDGWDSSDLDLRALDGSYFTNHFSDADPRPEVARFMAAFDKAFPGSPSTGTTRLVLAALAYDAANMMFQAIQAAGTDDTSRVRQALESMHFSGVTGELTFDRFHNPQKSAYIFTVKQRSVRFLKRIDP